MSTGTHGRWVNDVDQRFPNVGSVVELTIHSRVSQTNQQTQQTVRFHQQTNYSHSVRLIHRHIFIRHMAVYSHPSVYMALSDLFVWQTISYLYSIIYIATRIQILPCYPSNVWALNIPLTTFSTNFIRTIPMKPLWKFPEIGGTLNSSIFMGFSLINHPCYHFGVPHLWKPRCRQFL